MLVQLLGLFSDVINSEGCVHRGSTFCEGRAPQNFQCMFESFSLILCRTMWNTVIKIKCACLW